MKVLSVFDRNPKTIGLISNHTTLIGSMVGFLAVIVLICLGIAKVIPVINRQIIYLNYWRTQQTWPIQLKNFDIQFMLYAVILPTNHLPKLNTMLEKRDYSLMVPITNKNKDVIEFNSILTFRNRKSGRWTFEKHNLVSCTDQEEEEGLSFCFPPNTKINLSGSEYIQQEDCSEAKVEFSIKKNSNELSQNAIKVLSKNLNPQMAKQLRYHNSSFQQVLIVVVSYNFTEKSVNPKLPDPCYDTIVNKTDLKAFIYSTNATYELQTLYFQSVNVSTDNAIYPMFFNTDSEFNPYWKHLTKQDIRLKYNYPSPWFYTTVQFKRSASSVVYERSYKKIDSVLAEILGISSIIGIILYVIFGHYAKWSSEKYLLAAAKRKDRQTKQQQYQQDEQIKKQYYISYVKNKIVCNEEFNEQEKLDKKTITDLMQSGNLQKIYEQTMRLRECQQKIKLLQSVISANEQLRKTYKLVENEQLKQRKSIQKVNQIFENEPSNLSQSLLSSSK